MLYSQTQGVVLDANKAPIDKVNVFLSDQKILLYSKEDGSFSIQKNIPSNSFIHFYKFGYSSKVVQYNVDEELNITLDELHVNLDEVGVAESFSELGNNKLINIDKKSLKNNFTSTASMLESISQLSGIDMISSGLGIEKVVVRGLSGMRVVTYLNGMKIENQQWAGDHGIGFTDLGIHEVELIKGSSALKYGGEAVGGLLYFKDNPFVESNQPSGFVASKFDNSHHLFGNQVGFKWSKNNFYFNAYGQYNIASDYRMPNNQYLFNSRFKNNSVKFSIANRTNKFQNIFRYQYNNEQTGIPAHSHDDPDEIELGDISLNEIDFAEDFKLIRPNQFVDNHLFVYENNYFIKSSKVSFHLGHFINNLKEYEKWTVAAFDMTLSNTQIKSNIRTQFNDFTLNVGAQLGKLTNENNIQSRLIPDAITNDLGVYSILDYEKEKIGLNSGLRLDHKKISSDEKDYDKLFSAISYSSGVYFTESNHILRLTYSGAFRSPHFSELFSDGVHHGTSRYEIGNTNLKLEKGHQFDFKYQWSNNHLGIVVNPFYQLITDFISINPTDSFAQNNYRVYNYDQFDKVEISGFELNLHYHPHQLHNLHFEQSYSFINTRNLDKNTALALTPSNKIKTSLKLHLTENNSLLTLNKISVYHVYSFSQNNIVEYETSSDAYQLINLEFDFKPAKRIDLVLGLNNLLNQEYTPHLSRIKEIGGGVPNPGRSFNINLKYEF